MTPSYVKRLEREQKGRKERKIDLKFPYLNMKQYLLHRNLYHLASMIPWDAQNPDAPGRRTKSFINVLKIRLEFALPDKCGNITRNEAHIRLMSSVWYMTRLVQWLALVSIALILLVVLTICRYYASAHEHKWWEVSGPCLGWSALIIPAMWYVRASVEKSLHYQRVREIIYVLETAYFATVCGLWIPESGAGKTYPEILIGLEHAEEET